MLQDPDSAINEGATAARGPSAVVHIPHSSIVVPDDVRDTLVLSDSALRRELLRLTDRYTDELFALSALTAIPVVFGVSRFVVDPERFPDDALEPMATRGMGAVYTATTDGGPLRASLSGSERAELLARFYEPHHAALDAATRTVLDTTGHCLILDGHSFPNDPLPCDVNQDRPRPEICIGTDPFHTSDRLATAAVEGFAVHGLEVAVDRPYTGALVPARWHQRDVRVSALMIEINRRLYMDEATGEKLGVFPEMMAIAQSVCTTLVQEHSTSQRSGW